MISEKNLCHRRDSESCGKVTSETKCDNEGWKKYGDLYVRCTYGEASLTDLLVSYAKGLALNQN